MPLHCFSAKRTQHTPFAAHKAVVDANHSLLQRLANEGYNFNEIDDRGVNPLHFAAHYVESDSIVLMDKGDAKAAKILLDGDAHPDGRSGACPPLHVALKMWMMMNTMRHRMGLMGKVVPDFNEVARLLTQAGARVDIECNGTPLLYMAVRSQYLAS